ncbi:GSCFA domain-containing protein [Methylosinus sp. R-45379]|uniref:GSCFA domain-containing protein n=1 Tax=Methylosinus sp. R-45379 TaxID=980563 RepID=UPI000A007D6A|nr:GSCFA domain-containing protein [Methylosinus sp. R-45379]
MANPYHNRPFYTFWKSGVAEQTDVDPVVSSTLSLSRADAIATAGSCFAQHLSRTIMRQGFNYLVTEAYQERPGTVDENYGVFPARFGNVYTSRQLLQLFDRAYGLFRPKVDWWRGRQGEIIDPFRPRIQATGFHDVDLMRADRESHLAAVREMFECCKVFIFTLGLTETWLSKIDGSAFPLAPGVVATETPGDEAEFHNLSAAEVIKDLEEFLEKFSLVNPSANIILTISPVSLIATYEDRHVLVSTIASKSILRAAAEDICRRYRQVSYFPSYEIIVGPQSGGRFYAPDLREVAPEGVDYVMSIFSRHYLLDETAHAADLEPRAGGESKNAFDTPKSSSNALSTNPISESDMNRLKDVTAIICDEEAIVK